MQQPPNQANTTTGPTVQERRTARLFAYLNGGIWAVGNGLVSTYLIIFLALEYDAPGLGLGIGMLLASPRLIGVLRLFVPAAIGRLTGRKSFCIACFLLSGLTLLFIVPIAAGRFGDGNRAVVALVVVWGVYHLFQYFATIALWSWLGEIARFRLRSRFFGIRERWMVLGQAIAMLASGAIVWMWKELLPRSDQWIAYAVSTCMGVCYMLLAIVPLCQLRSCYRSRKALAADSETNKGAADEGRISIANYFAPFRDERFLRLLLFGVFFAIACGLTQAPQNVFPRRVLGVSLFVVLGLKTWMRLGQWTLGPFAGRYADRRGNLLVLIAGLLITATGTLFYLPAQSSGSWLWLIGAWTVWIGWVLVNVTLPSIVLRSSPRGADTPHIALYYALTDLSLALATIAGGWLFDNIGRGHGTVLHLPTLGSIDYYTYSFIAGWILRSLAAILFFVLLRKMIDRPEPMINKT